MSEHTIIKGETFAVLAKKYGVGTKAIEAANPGVNPTRLKIGQKIMIPPPKAGVGGGAASVNGGAVESNSKIYVVKSGDNLMKIAKAHGVTAKQLRAYNGLPTDQIKVGQKLKIPKS
jgi:LysM repeat protein